MRNFTDQQCKVMLEDIREDKFLAGNNKIYKFATQNDLDNAIDWLLNNNYINYKFPPTYTRDKRISFENKEYVIDFDGLNWLASH
ncbi:MAG: hypothetical protein VB100_14430 [Angelakisella sp.]|nr:hypothetical protein [Angelakisella sp.]